MKLWIMGERRWRAWGLLIAAGKRGGDHLEPCLIGSADPLERREAALVENAARVDLNHMEYAKAFERLAAQFGRSNRQIADTVGRTQRFVQQHRQLVELDERDQAQVAAGALPLHTALQMLRVPKPKPLRGDVRLTMAEVCHKVAAEHGEVRAYAKVEIAPDAAGDALKDLCSTGVLNRSTGWDDQREWLSIYYRTSPEIDLLLEAMRDPDAGSTTSLGPCTSFG